MNGRVISSDQPGARTGRASVLHVQQVLLDRQTRRAVIDGVDVGRLTPMQAELLAYLMERAGQVVSREDLITKVWGFAEGTRTNTVDKTLSTLRQRLGDDWRRPRFITTIWRHGVRFETGSAGGSDRRSGRVQARSRGAL